MTNKEVGQVNREKIIQTAKRLMLEIGVAATTKDLVAKEAGVALPTVVRNYRTKEELVYDVLQLIFEERVEYFKNQSADDKLLDEKGADLLKKFLRNTIEYFVKDPQSYALQGEVFTYYNRISEKKRLRDLMQQVPFTRQMRYIFERGVEDGSIKVEWSIENEVNYTCNLILGLMTFTTVEYELNNEEIEIAKEAMERLFRSICHRYIIGYDK